MLSNKESLGGSFSKHPAHWLLYRFQGLQHCVFLDNATTRGEMMRTPSFIFVNACSSIICMSNLLMALQGDHIAR
jgi:hypothetical protein